MARLNVYVPDDLAERSREAGLNVSALTQQALQAALAARETAAWLDSLTDAPATVIAAEEILMALDDVREDLDARG